MKNEKLGQEPAFASITSKPNGVIEKQKGMSKRFYAACAAMQGILSANPKETWGNINIPVPKYLAKIAYQFADELLKQENE